MNMADANNINNQQENADDNRQERFKELKKLLGQQESRIQNLQATAFQLANYYFVFQGVVLAAISNTTSLTCSDSWFIFTLSLFAATLNIFALFSIGSKYVRAMDLHDQTWFEYNYTARMLSTRPRPLEFTGVFSPGENDQNLQQEPRVLNEINGPWRDGFSVGRRYAVLSACMLFFIGFTAVTLSGPWLIICKHDHQQQRKHYVPYGDHMDCLKLCNGSRCMIFCRD
ncbi:UNVERIFIED_CONTAM: hypothetical protein Sradi_5013500 [Sesamum radiatum]|uniref:Transmembrane protein n=1 Tax=Sesamum radiatum TaxID=300843 RepID=A0AAW2MH27_SESRA